ncbi:hypothetical protein HYE82_12600 [Streptomyces sp. BR123]|uniref:hypothetical protein n=1 Tax=Streptomyces sp. BR123 TaxID=2749828 RepID=UPI0015C44748|nr:hypothetical protein [Streptomyces sp. BR123]NXY95209.1 hypothetical protein [Streptomyces sp. BR123]
MDSGRPFGSVRRDASAALTGGEEAISAFAKDGFRSSVTEDMRVITLSAMANGGKNVSETAMTR